MAITAGADPVALRQLATLMEQAATELRTIDRRLDGQIASAMAWKGRDSQLFRSHWSGSLRGQIGAAVGYLEQGQKVLVHQAEEQERASESDGAGAGAWAAAGLAAGTAGVSAATAQGTASSGVPLGAPPTQVTAWWNSLTPAEQAALIQSQPGVIGNLDGIPASVRDQANRRVLDDRISSLSAERETADPGRVVEIDKELSVLKSVTQSLEANGGKTQLLLLDLDGPGMPKAAVGLGDVDRADHVAVFTPGIGTTVEGDLGRYVGDMQDLKVQAEAMMLKRGQTGSVATIAWLGYEFPPSFTLNDPAGDLKIVDQFNALEGGAKLARFVEGIDSTHQGDPHLSVLGHSYGSAVSGAAVQLTDKADSFVAFGSPGLMTNDAADLKVPDGQRFVLEAKGDAIADAAWFGGADPNHMSGITSLSTRKSGDLNAVDGHSAYLANGSTSQYNLAAVVSGNSGEAIRGNDAGLGDVVVPALFGPIQVAQSTGHEAADGWNAGYEMGKKHAGTIGGVVAGTGGAVAGAVSGAVQGTGQVVKQMAVGTAGAVKDVWHALTPW